MNTQISRYLIGTVVALLGLSLLAGALNIFDAGSILKSWWPVLVIIIGVAIFVNDNKNYLWAMVVVFIGAFALLRTLGFYDGVNIWQIIWPVILIVVGVSIAMGKSILPQTKVEPGSDDIMAILGGSDQKNLSDDFTGTKVTAILGGAKIDLRKATIKKSATIEVFAFMGGAEIVVPRHVIIKNQTNAVLGGIENKTDQEIAKNAPVLMVVGDVILGGVEIKN